MNIEISVEDFLAVVNNRSYAYSMFLTLMNKVDNPDKDTDIRVASECYCELKMLEELMYRWSIPFQKNREFHYDQAKNISFWYYKYTYFDLEDY